MVAGELRLQVGPQVVGELQGERGYQATTQCERWRQRRTRVAAARTGEREGGDKQQARGARDAMRPAWHRTQ